MTPSHVAEFCLGFLLGVLLGKLLLRWLIPWLKRKATERTDRPFGLPHVRHAPSCPRMKPPKPEDRPE